MLQFENVSTFYGKIQALHSVNVEVRQGEIVTLIGANGAGKSTLLMTLCGSPQAHSGSIRYMGEELVGQDSSSIMRKSIAVVPEGRRVFAVGGGCCRSGGSARSCRRSPPRDRARASAPRSRRGSPPTPCGTSPDDRRQTQ